MHKQVQLAYSHSTGSCYLYVTPEGVECRGVASDPDTGKYLATPGIHVTWEELLHLRGLVSSTPYQDVTEPAREGKE